MYSKSKSLMMILISNLIATVCVLPWLPSKVPSQWDIHWNIARYQSKYFLVMLALLPIVLYLSHVVISKKSVDYKKKSDIKPYQIIYMGSIVLLIVVQWTMIFAAKYSDLHLKVILLSTLGVFLILTGNYMPTIKSNYFVGIRNPWTIKNQVVWKKTHRIGGYLFILLGMLLIPMAFIDVLLLQYMGITVLILVVVGLNVYSYILYRKL